MRVKPSFLIVLFALISCSQPKKKNMECCFERVKNRLESDSILQPLMYSSVDSYRNYASLINRTVVEDIKSNPVCSTAVDSFMRANNENSITVNNIIMFQQFQAYLKKKKFNFSDAKEKALKFEKRYAIDSSEIYPDRSDISTQR